LKNQENLSDEQKEVLEKVLGLSSTIKAAYELKESFRDIFKDSSNKEEAKEKLHTWILDILKREVVHYYSFVKTLLRWEGNILNYFVDRLSSGFVEGVNNKIKLIKRKAFGFRNFENFRMKIRDCFS
jgi:transposase